MAHENFTLYTETDPNNRFVVASDTITVTGLTKNEKAFIYDDKGIDHFNNFSHQHYAKITSIDAGGIVSVWQLANIVDDTFFILSSAAEDVLNISAFGTGLDLRLYEAQGSVSNFDSYTFTVGVGYWFTTERNGTAFTCKIYSDASRTTLLDTLSLTSSTTLYRYIYGVSSWSTGQVNAGSAIISEFDLQEFNANVSKTLPVTKPIKLPVLIPGTLPGYDSDGNIISS